MKNQIFIIAAMLLSLSGLAQKLTKEDKAQKKICDKYSESIADDFGRGTIIKTKAIRVGPALWVATSSIGDEKKLVVILVFTGVMTQEIKADEMHEFSLYNSDEKIVVKMTPHEIYKPVSKTASSGGYGSVPVSISTTTTYEMTYKFSEETYETFKKYIIKSVRIKSLSNDYPIKVDNEGRAKLFQSTVGCIGK